MTLSLSVSLSFRGPALQAPLSSLCLSSFEPPYNSNLKQQPFMRGLKSSRAWCPPQCSIMQYEEESYIYITTHMQRTFFLTPLGRQHTHTHTHYTRCSLFKRPSALLFLGVWRRRQARRAPRLVSRRSSSLRQHCVFCPGRFVNPCSIIFFGAHTGGVRWRHLADEALELSLVVPPLCFWLFSTCRPRDACPMLRPHAHTPCFPDAFVVCALLSLFLSFVAGAALRRCWGSESKLSAAVAAPSPPHRHRPPCPALLRDQCVRAFVCTPAIALNKEQATGLKMYMCCIIMKLQNSQRKPV